MNNPLYQQMSGQNPITNDILQRFQQFRQSFQGDPRMQIQQLLNSGQISQADYDRAVQIAQGLRKYLG